MKRIAFAACMAVFLFAIGAQAQTPAQTDVEHTTQELITLEKGWAEAVVKKDIAFFDRILADDYTEADSEGNVNTKSQYIANFKSNTFVVTSAVLDDINVRVYGDTAVVTGRNTMKGQYKGKDDSGQYRWTDIWVKRDGRWQCVAGHGSRIPQK